MTVKKTPRSASSEAAPASVENDQERVKLVRRLAVAGSMVVLLLGALAAFDYLASSSEEDEVPIFTKPVPVGKPKEITQPVKPAENLPAPPAEPPQNPSEPPPEPKEKSPSESAASKPLEKTVGEGEKSAFNLKSEEIKEVTKARPMSSTSGYSLERRDALASPATVTPYTPKRPLIMAPPAIEESTQGPRMFDRPVESPNTRVLGVSPGGVSNKEVFIPPRGLAGFLLQAGIFSSPQRAEELHAKLVLSGIPSTLETRVQVGPFKTRQEAEAAQQKLKALGVNTVLLPPTH